MLRVGTPSTKLLCASTDHLLDWIFLLPYNLYFVKMGFTWVAMATFDKITHGSGSHGRDLHSGSRLQPSARTRFLAAPRALAVIAKAKGAKRASIRLSQIASDLQSRVTGR